MTGKDKSNAQLRGHKARMEGKPFEKGNLLYKYFSQEWYDWQKGWEEANAELRQERQDSRAAANQQVDEIARNAAYAKAEEDKRRRCEMHLSQTQANAKSAIAKDKPISSILQTGLIGISAFVLLGIIGSFDFSSQTKVSESSAELHPTAEVSNNVTPTASESTARKSAERIHAQAEWNARFEKAEAERMKRIEASVEANKSARDEKEREPTTTATASDTSDPWVERNKRYVPGPEYKVMTETQLKRVVDHMVLQGANRAEADAFARTINESEKARQRRK